MKETDTIPKPPHCLATVGRWSSCHRCCWSGCVDYDRCGADAEAAEAAPAPEAAPVLQQTMQQTLQQARELAEDIRIALCRGGAGTGPAYEMDCTCNHCLCCRARRLIKKIDG